MSKDKDLDSTDQLYNDYREEKKESLKENKFVKLSVKGTQEYKQLQHSAFKQFGFWAFVGNVGGFVMAKFINTLPLKTTSPSKLKRYRYITYFTCLTVLSYHGYKVSRFDFLKQKKQMLQDPSNILDDPDELI
jgi:hypothetical protein